MEHYTSDDRNALVELLAAWRRYQATLHESGRLTSLSMMKGMNPQQIASTLERGKAEGRDAQAYRTQLALLVASISTQMAQLQILEETSKSPASDRDDYEQG